MYKVLYSGLQYNFYDPARGASFEHETFYRVLSELPGVTVLHHPFDRILTVGKKRWNEELLDLVRREQPDLLFAFMYTDEFEPATLDEIKKHTATAAWFSDDSWRFWNYSKFWARHFSWAITTYAWTKELYARSGQPNVICSQWAANTEVYRPVVNRAKGTQPPVTFIGGWSRPRERIIAALRRAGIAVEVFGSGWQNAQRASDEEKVRLFSSSTINLALNPPPGLFTVNSLGRLLFRRSMQKIVSDLHPIANIEAWLYEGVPQIKARHFEIPACGGFSIAGWSEGIERYYEPDKELVFYRTTGELIDKIHYYLDHAEERERIARAGYLRTIAEHTYVKRFAGIFEGVGLSKDIFT
jgi:spore maturation protein CgeB